MSFVVAAMKTGYAIIAGDTQLNDDNGAILETGIKVFPITRNTVMGITGNYVEIADAYNEIMKQIESNNTFIQIVSIIDRTTKQIVKKYNGIIVTCCDNSIYYSIISDQPEWKEDIKKAGEGNVRVLIPPDITEEFCYQFFNSLSDLKRQAINCVKKVGEKSESVNNKVFGAELTKDGIVFFTDGIRYEDISFRIQN